MNDAICRDCLTEQNIEKSVRCSNCNSPRTVRHPEINALSIAHLDCDAFYAAIEKRDNPELIDKPVIIGGGRRGVVSTACYIARTYGVHSAQPMFKALKACPDAIVVKGRMDVYSQTGREIREMMRALTPMVEPLSIDEAFLDLSGTERLHGHSPALTMAHLAKKIETEVGITVSIGLSYCKFLAKIASDLDKPRGFSVIGREESLSFLAKQPVSLIWGVGKAFQKTLSRDGIKTIGQLQKMDQKELVKSYGTMGLRLFKLANADDTRSVNPIAPTKSISSETTFNHDKSDQKSLEHTLWQLSEKVSARAKKADLAGETIVLKLKTATFKTRTRNRKLTRPTQLADRIFQTATELLGPEIDGTPYRLLGVGLSNLCDGDLADHPDLLTETADKRADAERAIDSVRQKFGTEAIIKGRTIKSDTDN